MPTPQRTSDGKWVIFDRATGERLVRWPVDARELLASGDFTADDPTGEPGDSPAAPASSAPELAAPSAPALPTEHSPGVPLVVTKSEDAPPAAPLTLPTTRTTAQPSPRGRR